MTDYGVTETGFVIKPLEVILQEIEEKQRADIHPALNQTATSVLGQLNGIFAAKTREVWELAESVYSSFNPDNSEDESLDSNAALCPGITRDAAVKSRVTATCNLDTGTYAAGTLIANVQDDTDARFVSTVEVVVVSGPSDESVVFEAETAGAVEAPSGTLIEISEPVTGWNSVTNSDDAEVGEDVESNPGFRLRREEEIRRAGAAHVDAIKADVLDIEEVIACVVFENDSDVSANGMVPHSVRVVIWDGNPAGADDADVADAIYESKAAGIDLNGAVTSDVEDTMGFPHTMRFDRAVEKVLEINVEVTTEDEPVDWQAQIKSVLMDYVTDNMSIGDDAIIKKLEGVVTDFDWVIDLTDFEIFWTGDSPGTINLTVNDDEMATLDSSDVVVGPS